MFKGNSAPSNVDDASTTSRCDNQKTETILWLPEIETIDIYPIEGDGPYNRTLNNSSHETDALIYFDAPTPVTDPPPIDFDQLIEATFGNSVEDAATETQWPFEEVSVYVDHTKKEVEIGGCSVFFCDGSFNEMEKITIRAEINPLLHPAEFEAITPILTINAPNLRSQATVKLHTWCVPVKCKRKMYIMRCDQTTNEWEEFGSIYLGDSRCIEFSISQFSRLGVFRRIFGQIRRFFSSPPRYYLQPIVYYKGVNFALAVILDTALMEKLLQSVMEGDYGKDVQAFKTRILRAEKTSDIKMAIEFPLRIQKEKNQPLRLEPPQKKFRHPTKEIWKTKKPIFETFTLEGSELVQTKNITIKYIVKKNAAMECNGTFSIPNPSFKPPQQEGGSRSAIEVNINQGNATGTQVGAGGQYNENSTDTTKYITTQFS